MTEQPYRIEWRPMAREDLRAIVRYIGKDNPTRAKSFGQELRDKTKPPAQSWYQFFGQCIKVDRHALTKERNP